MLSAQKRRYELTQSQKLMVFILSMSLYGISNMFSELIPSIQVGPIELKVEYFAFIPLTLCILFHPLYAAIGASFGEVIFGELLLGQFGGLGELEKFIVFTLGMYIAGMLVSDPCNRKQLAIASFAAVGICQLLGALVDMGKVWVGIEDLETLPGIPESILLIEGIGFLNAMAITGVFFSLLPVLYLVPRLYGKIEPLLGMKPRDGRIPIKFGEVLRPRLVITVILLMALATAAEFMSESDINFAVWEPEFLEQFGGGFIWVSIGAALLVFVVTLIAMTRGKKQAVSAPRDVKQ
ncbi:cell division protein FtsQ [Paenibacillus sp. LHD-117]|uniref:cell division protein FtsQ n=1 Tax=Paenibacillus sp. LHD-117 TaxID=3071412 RepID=UPI0027E046C8|nr:cell division protein FtsQ [Paenibacillus sp. LHD-117]MDQ6422185.1 cell division protein FtsQ [Paenibacillus sp. LHD-117]